MAFGHGCAATLKIGATDLEGYIESASMDLTRELAEIKVLSAGSVARVAGLRDIKFTAEGAFDATADAALFAVWNGAAVAEVIFSPDGTTTYTVDVWMPQYSVKVSSTDKQTWSIQLASSGDVTRA